MEFSDLYLTADEYFDILRDAWEKSEYFDGWDRNWHPEDLHSNLEAVFDGVGCGLIAYTHLVGKKVRQKQYNTNKKTVSDMHDQAKTMREKVMEEKERLDNIKPSKVLPRGQWDEYYEAYSANSTLEFGDNV